MTETALTLLSRAEIAISAIGQKRLSTARGKRVLKLLESLYAAWPEGAVQLAKSMFRLMDKYQYDVETLTHVEWHFKRARQDAEYFSFLLLSSGLEFSLANYPKPAPELNQPPYRYRQFEPLLSKADYYTACEAVGIALQRPEIESLLLPEIRVILKANEIPMRGASKIGGKPDLHPDLEWPVDRNKLSLDFLAQFNLHSIAHLKTGLPKSGLLSFFYDKTGMSWGSLADDPTSWRVLYQDDLASLESRDFPPDLQSDKFRACTVHLADAFGLPTFWTRPEIVQMLGKDNSEPYMSLMPTFATKLLGHPQDLQSDLRRDLALAHYGYSWAEYMEQPRVYEKIDASLQDWVLLFQLDSNWSELGMCWGDVGRLYFCMHKNDFIHLRFDCVKLVLQCH